MKHAEPRFSGSRSALISDGIEAVLTPEIRDRLYRLSTLVSRWNTTIKLVSIQDVPHLWTRHIDDALQMVSHLPPALTHAVDLGSGGGFPGLVLAIATGVHFDLIEADSRKAAFLQEAANTTEASVSIHAGRIEDVAVLSRKLVTARALAPLPKLLELAQPFLASGGICLFPKGQRVDVEIADAQTDWIMDLDQIPSRTSPTGRILRISGLRRREANGT